MFLPTNRSTVTPSPISIPTECTPAYLPRISLTADRTIAHSPPRLIRAGLLAVGKLRHFTPPEVLTGTQLGTFFRPTLPVVNLFRHLFTSKPPASSSGRRKSANERPTVYLPRIVLRPEPTISGLALTRSLLI